MTIEKWFNNELIKYADDPIFMLEGISLEVGELIYVLKDCEEFSRGERYSLMKKLRNIKEKVEEISKEIVTIKIIDKEE